MSCKTKLILALSGVAVVLIGELMAVFEHTLATRPVFIMGFAVIAALGFWAMSLHRLGR